MSTTDNPSFIRPGFHTLTPSLAFEDAAAAIDFYKEAFGAEELFRMPGYDGKGVGHAELRIGDSVLMLSDEYPDMNIRSAAHYGGSPMRLHIYVEDVDNSFDRAVKTGCKITRPIENMFYGDRTGCLDDPFGYSWTLSTFCEDVSAEEMMRRMAETPEAEAAKADG